MTRKRAPKTTTKAPGEIGEATGDFTYTYPRQANAALEAAGFVYAPSADAWLHVDGREAHASDGLVGSSAVVTVRGPRAALAAAAAAAMTRKRAPKATRPALGETGEFNYRVDGEAPTALEAAGFVWVPKADAWLHPTDGRKATIRDLRPGAVVTVLPPPTIELATLATEALRRLAKYARESWLRSAAQHEIDGRAAADAAAAAQAPECQLEVVLGQADFGTPEPRILVTARRGTSHRVVRAAAHRLAAEVEEATLAAGGEWIVRVEHSSSDEEVRVVLELIDGTKAEVEAGLEVLHAAVARPR